MIISIYRYSKNRPQYHFIRDRERRLTLIASLNDWWGFDSPLFKTEALNDDFGASLASGLEKLCA